MTALEQHYDYKLKIDKIDTLDVDNMLPAEIDWILNEAQEILIKQRYGGNNSKKLGFEESQKRTDDLKTLVIKSPTTTQPGLVPVQSVGNKLEIKLSDLAFDYMFLLRGFAKATKEGCPSKLVKLVQQQHDDFNELQISGDPFHTPSYDWGEIPILFGRTDTVQDDKGSIYLYIDPEFEVDEVYLEYIKWPNRISVGGYNYIDGTPNPAQDSDLPDTVSRDVVDIAVAETSRIIQSPDFLALRKDKLLIQE